MGSRWTGAQVTRSRAYWSARILEAIAAGSPLRCPFCDAPVTLHLEPWDVDHADQLIDGGILGRANQRPAHRACNRAAGAREGNRRRTRRNRRTRG